MTTNQLTKPHPGTEPKGATIKAEAWRNLHFLKDGRHWPGVVTFSTERKAREQAEQANREEKEMAEASRRNGHELVFYVDWVAPMIDYFHSEYSHHIQIPAKAP